MRDIQELRDMQALPLRFKLPLTEYRVRQWVHEYGEEGCYVSFSGGKDSTVLLHIVREVMGYKNVPAVFVDTGLEYPEIREFVKTFDNVTWLKPKLNFKQVIEKYGYPFISKEVSECVAGARRYLREVLENVEREREREYRTDISTTSSLAQAVIRQRRLPLTSTNKPFKIQQWGGEIASIAKSEELANMLNERMHNRKGGSNRRLAIMLGTLTKDGQIKANIPKGDKSNYAQTRYQFFLEAPFEISNQCCNVMKKAPSHQYAKETGRVAMTAEMADESRLRTQQWLKNGCNGFQMQSPKSMPMAFWTEQDVLQYIKENNLPICSVYGDIITDQSDTDQLDGQMDLSDFLDGVEKKPCKLKTTGCSRTGCLFCMFGAHLEKPGEGRLERMKETHPKQYEWIMKDWEEGGLGYKKVIDWINANNGKGTIIRY